MLTSLARQRRRGAYRTWSPARGGVVSEASDSQRRLAPVRSGAYSRGPEVTKLRDQRARSRIRRKRRELPHLDDTDRDLLLAWARLSVLAQDLYADLLSRGAFNEQGEARR